jgi:hypothetical protein
LNQRIKYFLILIILATFCNQKNHAQELSLDIIINNKINKALVKKLDYKKKHKDSISIYNEANGFYKKLKAVGYFTSTLDSIVKLKKTYSTYFTLNTKIDSVHLKINPKNQYLFNSYQIKKNILELPISVLQKTLENASTFLEKEGKSFSKIKLDEIVIIEKTIYATVNVNESTQRIINKTIIRGYDNFSNSYLKNYFKINKQTIFNQKKIKEISELTQNLNFVKEIKKPEILFKADSTLLYLYLKKKSNNSFDALVNFASKKNGGLLFNGNANLMLSNILNSGEEFELFWNSIGLERQEFRLKTKIPYIFNSKISPEVLFSIYKQDSSFLTTKFKTQINYNLNSKNKIGLNFNSETSESFINTQNNIQTFKSSFLGVSYTFTLPKNDFFYNNKLFFNLEPSFGTRKTDTNSAQQFKLLTTSSILFEINTRSSIYIKNETGYLNSNTLIDNEFFRIGGANSIRGFDEQSIFTNKYTFFNTEYRYLASEKSYLYSLLDFGGFKNNEQNTFLISAGLGYTFSNDNYKINLATVVGKEQSDPINFKNTKIIISWINYF